MPGWRLTTACDRAARLISLELDGELGRREHAVLDRHLDRCPDCASLRESTRTVATIMRLTPPEHPALPVVIPARRVSRRSRASHGAVAAVAMAALAAIIAALIGLQQAPSGSTSWTSVALAEQVRLAEAQIMPPQNLPPLKDDLTATPLPAQPYPACSLGCWPQAGV